MGYGAFLAQMALVAAAGTPVPAGALPLWDWTTLREEEDFQVSQMATDGEGTVVAVGLAPLLTDYDRIGGGAPWVLTSTDGGATWARVGMPEGASPAVVAWGNGRFIALGDDGRPLTSADGLTWIQHGVQPVLAGEGYNGRFAYHLIWQGERFLALLTERVKTKRCLTVIAGSADGITWSEKYQGCLNFTGRLTLAARGDLVVAIGYALFLPNEHACLLSQDGGKTWRVREISHPFHLIVPFGGGFAAVAPTAYRQFGVFTSPDGIDWTLRHQDLGFRPEVLVAGPGGLMAVGDGSRTAFTSDADAWQPGGGWDPRTTLVLSAGVGLSDGTFLAAGAAGTILHFTAGGATWQQRRRTAGPDLVATAASNQAVVAVGSTWLPGMSPVLASADGLTWHEVPVPLSDFAQLTDVAWSGERFVAVGSQGEIITSGDGWTWESVRSGGGQPLRALAAGGGRLVAAGGGGSAAILVSLDHGAIWQESPLPAEAGVLRSVAWRDDTFVAVGEAGTMLHSEDGHSWRLTRHDGIIFTTIAAAPHRWVAMGREGGGSTAAWLGLVSRDGLTWTRREVLGNTPTTPGCIDRLLWTGRSFLLGRSSLPSGEPLLESLDGLRWSRGGLQWSRGGWASGTPGVVSHLGLVLSLERRGRILARPDLLTHPGQGAPFRYLVPAAAHTRGLKGTHWLSELVLDARSGWESPVADLFLLTSGEATARGSGKRLTLPGEYNRTWTVLDDPVHETFGLPLGAGAVLITSNHPLGGWSRTFNLTPDGTYGQLKPLIPLPPEGLPEEQVLIGLVHTAEFRTNLGLVNLGAEPLTADISLYDHVGALLGVVRRQLSAYNYQLSTTLMGQLAPQGLAEGWAVVSFSGGVPGSGLAFASVIDQASGDPVLTQPPTVSDAPQVIPVVAHLPGRNDTFWRSDVVVANPNPAPARFRFELRLEGPALVSGEYTLAAGRSVRYPDVVRGLFNRTGKGALTLVPLAGSLAVSSRTFTADARGTFGQLVPPLPVGQGGASSVCLTGLPWSRDQDDGFRTNLGLLNLGFEPREARIYFHDEKGGSMRPYVQNLTLQPGVLVQIGPLFVGDPHLPAKGRGAVIVNILGGASDLAAYASVVDNRTGDAVFIPAAQVAAP